MPCLDHWRRNTTSSFKSCKPSNCHGYSSINIYSINALTIYSNLIKQNINRSDDTLNYAQFPIFFFKYWKKKKLCVFLVSLFRLLPYGTFKLTEPDNQEIETEYITLCVTVHSEGSNINFFTFCVYFIDLSNRISR